VMVPTYTGITTAPATTVQFQYGWLRISPLLLVEVHPSRNVCVSYQGRWSSYGIRLNTLQRECTYSNGYENFSGTDLMTGNEIWTPGLAY
jgi:hypothetical protein